MTSTASAQPADTAAAQFDYGLKEMEAKRYDSGCPALAESYRLEPRPGSLFTLASCEDQWGKIASALLHYEAYLDLFGKMTTEEQAKQKGRDAIALRQSSALKGQVPELTLALPAGAPSGTTVKRDGMGATLGAAIPLDPGEHVITLTLPDGRSRETRVTLAKGEKRRVTLELPGDTGGGGTVSNTGGEKPVDTDHGATASGGSKTLPFVIGGLGVVGLGVGTVFGIITLGKKSTINSDCPTNNVCTTQEGKDAADSAKTTGLISTIGFGVGVVGVGVAAVMLLTGGGADSTTSTATTTRVRPIVETGPRGSVVGLSGSF